MRLVVVDIGELESEEKEGIVEFMESKLPIKCEREGDAVTFEDKNSRTHVRSPEIRTYLKRYIHSKDMKKEYRLLSEEGALKFVKQKVEEEEPEK